MEQPLCQFSTHRTARPGSCWLQGLSSIQELAQWRVGRASIYDHIGALETKTFVLLRKPRPASGSLSNAPGGQRGFSLVWRGFRVEFVIRRSLGESRHKRCNGSRIKSWQMRRGENLEVIDMPTIAIIDDHTIVREGLRKLLEAREDFQVIGEAQDGVEGVELVLKMKPDVAIMDICMPKMSGVEATRKICQSGSSTKVLVLSMNDNSGRIGEVLRAGAAGYIVKDATSVDLCQAIEDVCGGASYLSPSITPRVMNLLRQTEQNPSHGIGMLTGREREVLQLIPDGLSTKEIAVVLGVSRKTIESHRASLMEKLNIHKMSSLVRYAVRVGLVEA